jgi:hypothetical protein
MMERDRRLTGSHRGQSVSLHPLEFSVRLSLELNDTADRDLSANGRMSGRYTDGQTESVAPKDFSTNSVWQTERVS